MMSERKSHTAANEPEYAGLRFSVGEYMALPETQRRYELVDGVVELLPSPTVRHQHVAGEILATISSFLTDESLDIVLYGVDVPFNRSLDGRDVVYRPDIIFISGGRTAKSWEYIHVVPDVVVEVVSASSRIRDTVAKFRDYERAGVKEYWLIDPDEDRMTFYRHTGDKFVEVPCAGGFYDSEAVAGFRLNLDKVRKAFRAFK